MNTSSLGATGVAGFRLELNKASALIPAVGGQFGQRPNLRDRVSEIHPDMPLVLTRKAGH